METGGGSGSKTQRFSRHGEQRSKGIGVRNPVILGGG